MTDPLACDAVDLVAAYRSGALSPREVMAAVLASAERAQGVVNAFTRIEHEPALAAAAASEARWRAGTPIGPLDGVPVTVKDNLAWAGRPVRRGSTTTTDTPAGEDAPVVARLVEAGAIPFAGTTMPDLGWKGVGTSPLWGVTRNPWDTRVGTGGSSAGAGAAAALNLGPLHLGTDAAGSIRIPASFCGVVGLKPSRGRVPAHPPSPFQLLAVIGPLTRTVRDAALMMGVITAPDARDPGALAEPAPDYLVGLEDGVRGWRIAFSPRLGHGRGLDAETERLVAAATQAFAEMGAVVEPADPGFDDPFPQVRTLWAAAAFSLLRAVPEDRRAGMDPGLVAIAESGREVSGADVLAAWNARAGVHIAMARLFQRFDLLVTPTLARPAFDATLDSPDGRVGEAWFAWAPFSHPFNLGGHPAASVPCGLTAAGLPVGLQIVGPLGGDARVLRAARAFEAVRPWPKLDAPRVRHG